MTNSYIIPAVMNIKNVISFGTSAFLKRLFALRKSLAVLLIALLMASAVSTANSQTYTLEDRDRLIRVEEQIKSLNVKIDAKFESMDAKFESMDAKLKAIDDKFNAMFVAMDDKINKLYTLMYFVLGGVFGLIGLIFWDRKTALAPVARDTRKLKEILYQLSKTNPELKDIINKAAL